MSATDRKKNLQPLNSWRPRIFFCCPFTTLLSSRIRVVFASLLLGLGAMLALASDARAAETSSQISALWIGITIAVLFAIIALFVGYMFYLQKKFLKACNDTKQLDTFLQAPAGLPPGTIRSILTLIIVAFSLYLLILAAFGIGADFPQALAAVFSTVIGFYFGSRTAGRAAEQAQQEQVKQLQSARNKAVSENEEEKATSLLTKVKKGLTMTKLAAEFLPRDLRKKYDETIGKLEQGVTTVESLTKVGNPAGALVEATKALEIFKQGNPVRDIVEKASLSFGRVLGGAVPTIALITTLVGVGTKLVGMAYEKWRARILGAPFSPALIPLKVVDANTGFTIFLKSPIFKTVYIKELEENDRKFMQKAVQAFLGTDTTEALYNKYRKRFESREQFEKGLQEFRHAAADLEIKQDVNPQWVADVGGYDQLMHQVDQIHADPEAKADLDALVTIAEGLQEKGEPVMSIIDKVCKEVFK